MVIAWWVIFVLSQSGPRHPDRLREAENDIRELASGMPAHHALSHLKTLGEDAEVFFLLAEAMPGAQGVRGRDNLAEAMSLTAVPQGEGWLLRLLKDEDAFIRLSALRGIARIHPSTGVEIAPLLNDKSASVRKEASSLLGAIHQVEWGKALLTAAQTESEIDVRVEMIRAVGSSGDTHQSAGLRRFLSSSSESTREAAVATLSQLEQPQPLNLQDKLVQSSQQFLGVPYQFSPLGEGKGVDSDPLFRNDSVDCLTFIEQSMALALSPKASQALPVLNRIRYRSEVLYEDRNHLMEAEWIPNNLAKGFIRDVTRIVGGSEAVETFKQITAETWTSPSSQALHLPVQRQPIGNYPLEIIPIEKFLDLSGKIVSGTLLFVVRKERPLKVTRITHGGILVRKQLKLFIRHAAKSRYGRVVDEPIESFVDHNKRYDAWTVEGFTLYAFQSPEDIGTHDRKPSGI